MIKRRQFIQAVASASAAPAVLAQQTGKPARPAATTGQAPGEIELTVSDAAAHGTPSFLDQRELAALRRLSDILMPAGNGSAGALDAGAPEFLDFLIAHSSAERRQLYRTGLGALNLQAALRFNKPFAEVEATEADDLLAPLREPWRHEPPADPLARFLLAAKHDIHTATVNSREWAKAAAQERGRRRRGLGMYWYTVE